MNRTEVCEQIKQMISENLRIPEDLLEYDADLFGEESDIALDSIDSMEIIAGVDELYGIDMTGVGKEHFRSIDTLADYVMSKAE